MKKLNYGKRTIQINVKSTLSVQEKKIRLRLLYIRKNGPQKIEIKYSSLLKIGMTIIKIVRKIIH